MHIIAIYSFSKYWFSDCYVPGTLNVLGISGERNSCLLGPHKIGKLYVKW